jgi:hypothetical protein
MKFIDVERFDELHQGAMIVGLGPTLLENHAVIIQLGNKEVCQHIIIYKTICLMPRKENWPINLCLADSSRHLWNEYKQEIQHIMLMYIYLKVT